MEPAAEEAKRASEPEAAAEERCVSHSALHAEDTMFYEKGGEDTVRILAARRDAARPASGAEGEVGRGQRGSRCDRPASFDAARKPGADLTAHPPGLRPAVARDR